MVFLNSIFATATPGGWSDMLPTIGMFVLVIAIMYFMMIRPQRQQQKKIETFRNGLQPGQEVITSGGIYGKIKEIDGNIVVIEIAHNVNVRVDISVVFANPGAMKEEGK